MPAWCATAPQLRAELRAATREQHQKLDDLLGRLDLADRRDYTRFLDIQLSARRGVEQWLYLNAPAHWLPPSQVSLLRRDLEWLGYEPRDARAPSFLVLFSDPFEWIGAAWVLAGSSLGNKMMERELAARAPASWPMAFLQDKTMPHYFTALRPLLEDDAANREAIDAAKAVFAHFLSLAEQEMLAVPA